MSEQPNMSPAVSGSTQNRFSLPSLGSAGERHRLASVQGREWDEEFESQVDPPAFLLFALFTLFHSVGTG